MCSLLQLVSEKVSPASTCPYLKVSLCGSGSGHVMEDKCARVNCSVLQIPFPMSLLIKKKGRPAVAHGPSEAVEWRWGLHRSLKAKGKKNDMPCYDHEAVCGWKYFNPSPVTGMSQFAWKKVVLIVWEPCVQPQSESPSAGAISEAQVDVEGYLKSRKWEQCVWTGGESSFVLFPISLMALKKKKFLCSCMDV